MSVSKPPVAIIEHADIRRMLLHAKTAVEGSMALILTCSRLVDEQDVVLAGSGDREAQACLHAAAVGPHGQVDGLTEPTELDDAGAQPFDIVAPQSIAVAMDSRSPQVKQ